MGDIGITREQIRPDTKMARALIVDDDPDIVDSLKSVLDVENLSIEVLTAGNEETAREIAESWPIDIALLDIRLGNKNGLDLVPLLKQRNKYIQCVMMTGYPDIQYAVNAIRFGADDFLRKPVDTDHLLSAFKRYLKYQTFMRERDQAESWFRTVFKTSDQMLFIADLAGNIVQINEKALAFCGVEKHDAVGRKIWSLPPWGGREKTSSVVRDAFNLKNTVDRTSVELDVAPSRIDRSTIEFLIRPLPGIDSGDDYLLVEGRDITEVREKERNLQRRAYHDDLTGLPNRTQLLNTLSNLCSIGVRRNRSC